MRGKFCTALASCARLWLQRSDAQMPRSRQSHIALLGSVLPVTVTGTARPRAVPPNGPTAANVAAMNGKSTLEQLYVTPEVVK